MIIVSYGGGTNSTAMLVALKEMGKIPDLITFADTRAEKPITYQHIDYMQGWCAANGFPEITVVINGGAGESLEDNCLRRKALPSIAYGFKTCSQRWKLQPQEVFYNNHPMSKAEFKSGNKITRAIGFDADEPHRARDFDDLKFTNWYPLIELDWGRGECIESIKREGIPIPGKSACYFCPSSKVSEVRSLAVTNPNLMDRAIAMERNADLDTVKGLGRSYSWESVIATDDLFPDNFIEQSCGCYDG
jgi:hypothetical protein